MHFENAELLVRALDIAIAADNAAGVFLVMLKLIETSLLMATQLKYANAQAMTEKTYADE